MLSCLDGHLKVNISAFPSKSSFGLKCTKLFSYLALTTELKISFIYPAIFAMLLLGEATNNSKLQSKSALMCLKTCKIFLDGK